MLRPEPRIKRGSLTYNAAMERLEYYSLPELVQQIAMPNRSRCQKLINDATDIFTSAKGSSRNHQAWAGGYWDHITEIMNIGFQLYRLWERTGRLKKLPRDERFNLSDVLLVCFLHDLEKPWKYADKKDQSMTKDERKAFRETLILDYKIKLSDNQQNALRYAEGVRDNEYSPHDRTMRPLAVVVHTADLLSARLFYDFPLEKNDPWKRAPRASLPLPLRDL